MGTYYTKEEVCVDKKIDSGLTEIILGINISDRNNAKDRANNKRTYFYELYEKIEDKGSRYFQFVGYAIPN